MFGKGPVIRAIFFFILSRKLKHIAVRIATFVTNFSRNKIECWKMTGNMLRKVDSSSTFCNRFYFCCSYYHWSFNLSRNKFEFNACDWRLQSPATQQTKNIARLGFKTAWIWSRPVTDPGHLTALTRSHLIGDHPSGFNNKQQKQWTLALKQKGCDTIPAYEI